MKSGITFTLRAGDLGREEAHSFNHNLLTALTSTPRGFIAPQGYWGLTTGFREPGLRGFPLVSRSESTKHTAYTSNIRFIPQTTNAIRIDSYAAGATSTKIQVLNGLVINDTTSAIPLAGTVSNTSSLLRREGHSLLVNHRVALSGCTHLYKLVSRASWPL
jgi:hypothetical protein